MAMPANLARVTGTPAAEDGPWPWVNGALIPGSGHGQADQAPRGKCKYMERVGVSGRTGYRWKALGELSRSPLLLF